MARREARILTSIWQDDEFLAMHASAQRLYIFVLSQPDLSHAGLLPMRLSKWARKMSDGTVDAVRADLDHLDVKRFLVVDYDTEEVLVRTLIRNDGVYKQPNVMACVPGEAQLIESRRLRAAFIAEIDRLPIDELSDRPGGRDGDKPSTRSAVQGVIDTLRADFAGSSGNPSGTLPEGYAEPTTHARARIPNPLSPIPVPQSPKTTSSSVSDDPGDDDPDPAVEGLCDHLADRIEANGAKRPAVTRRWRQAARLMLERDGRSAEQIRKAIDWCQDDEFWRGNVLSMPKLREKFDTLRLHADRGRAAPVTPIRGHPATGRTYAAPANGRPGREW